MQSDISSIILTLTPYCRKKRGEIMRFYLRIAAECFICFVFPFMAQAQPVLTAFPKPLQFYCRNAQDSAVAAVTGTVTAAGPESVTVTLYKNNIQTLHLAQRLHYSGATASFGFSPKIHAELSMYKFELRVDTALYASADSVVCGDAFTIDGQSNSVTQASYNYSSKWIRSFGSSTTDAAPSQADSTWAVAQSMTIYSHGAIGVWGMQVARHIIENSQIPVCIINGGYNGTSIESHARDLTYSSIYGRLYNRVRRAELLNGIRAVFWHQGESGYDPAMYRTNFLNLCSSWKTDYPSIERYYLFQTRPGCGIASGQDIVREAQRIIPVGRPDISIMSTVDLPGHDGCHYAANGYIQMGDQLYRLVARDFYVSSDTARICPPNIQEARFADMAHTRLILRFDQPVLVPADPGIKHAFALGKTVTALDSVKADTAANTITIYFHVPSDSATISYGPDTWNSATYEGPWLYNTRGIGALTFHRFIVSANTEDEPGTMDLENHSLTVAPNPFNPSVNIKVAGWKNGTELKILNINGKVVVNLTTVLNNGSQKSGLRQVSWNASGHASGVYVVMLKNGNSKLKQKVMLIR